MGREPLKKLYVKLADGGTVEYNVEDITLPPYSPADVQVVMESARLLRPREPDPLRCEACDRELTKPGGYAGTGLCGPCATGESETLAERRDTW